MEGNPLDLHKYVDHPLVLPTRIGFHLGEREANKIHM